MGTTYESPSVDAGTVENTWRVIAEEVDGMPVAKSIGALELERSAAFSMRADADRWAAAQSAQGFAVRGPSPLATWRYKGPTDSPSNAWAVRATRPIVADDHDDELAPALADELAGAATTAVAALDAAGNDLLELHGVLVTNIRSDYREGDAPLLDAMLTALERRIMARGQYVSGARRLGVALGAIGESLRVR